MKGKSPDPQQRILFAQELRDLLNPEHPLFKLYENVPWKDLEEFFASFYSRKGRPAKPVRLMISLILLKNIYSLSDESVVEMWVENPYFQLLSGETVFQWKTPLHPSDLVYFRRRVGEEGMEKILQLIDNP